MNALLSGFPRSAFFPEIFSSLLFPRSQNLPGRRFSRRFQRPRFLFSPFVSFSASLEDPP